MKQIFSLILITATTFASAQIKLAAKGNLLFKTDKPTWEAISNTATAAYKESGKNNIWFNFGVSAKIELPATSFFLMPEIYYTTFKSEFDVPDENVTLEIKSNRIDIPVLLGYDLFGDTLGVFAGPVASYNFDKNDQFKDFTEDTKNKFRMGYQFGAQVQISKMILNARYEGAFSEDQRDFINKTNPSDYVVRYDSRPSMLIFGVGYQF